MRGGVAQFLEPRAQLVLVVAEARVEERSQGSAEGLRWAGESPLKQADELVETTRGVIVGERLDHERHPVLAIAELVEHRLIKVDLLSCPDYAFQRPVLQTNSLREPGSTFLARGDEDHWWPRGRDFAAAPLRDGD